MALNHRTYAAIPRLYNYTDAKRHYDNIAPIRGCAGEARPVGRRDQPWFSIWETDAGIHVGYGRAKELSERQTLVLYSRNGTIQLYKRNRWSSASDHERRERLLGADFRTHQFDTWVRCAWYEGGERRKGYLPLRCNGSTSWKDTPAVSTFVRDETGLVFLNYTYPVTHKPNKVRLKEALTPYHEFIRFCEGLTKLQGGRKLEITAETKAEFFGWAEHSDYRGNRYANPAPRLYWRGEGAENRAKFYAWAASDDPDDRMKAAITFAQNAYDATKPVAFLTDLLLRDRHDTLLDKEVHTSGKLVTDRYKRFLRD